GDTSMYIVNSEALKAYSNMGFLGLTLPFEYEEDNDNYKYATKVIYGKICAMISKGCVNSYFTGCEKEKGLDDIEKAPVKRINLTAKAPKKTPLKRDEFTALNYCKFCYNRVITRDAFDEINRLGQYKNKGINIFRIDFYDENKEEVERVLGRI
nr:hypothetical protein [Lachnospiraceae bacterium]